MSRTDRLDWEDPAAVPSDDPEWFLDLVEGTLSAAEEREYRRQLRRDADLQRRFDSYQAKIDLLRQVGEADADATPSRALRERILAAVAAEAAPPTPRRRPLPWLAILASGSLAAAAALFFAVQLKEPSTVPSHEDLAFDKSGMAGKKGLVDSERGRLDHDAEQSRQVLEGARFERQSDAPRGDARTEEAKAAGQPAPEVEDLRRAGARDDLAKDAAPKDAWRKEKAAPDGLGDQGSEGRAARPSAKPRGGLGGGGEAAAPGERKDFKALEETTGIGDDRQVAVNKEPASQAKVPASVPTPTEKLGEPVTVLFVDAGNARSELDGYLTGLQLSTQQLSRDARNAFVVPSPRAPAPAETGFGQREITLDLDPSLPSELVRLQGSRQMVGEALRQVMQRFKAQVHEVPRALLAGASTPAAVKPAEEQAEPPPAAADVPRTEASERQQGAAVANDRALERLLRETKTLPGRTAGKKPDDALEVWLLVQSRAAPAKPAEPETKR